jgi:multidrug resistance efflux pump
MPIPFSRTVRALKNDGQKRSLWGLFFGLVLLGGWGAWMFLTKVSVYSSSDRVRLEVDTGVYSIEAFGSGRVITSNLILGKQVKAGDLLVELDDTSQRLELDAAEKSLASLPGQLSSKENEVAALIKGGSAIKGDRQTAIAEAKARYEEARLAAEAAESEERLAKDLFQKGINSETEYQAKKNLADQARARARTAKASIKTAGSGASLQGSNKDAQIASLQGEIERLKGDIATKESSVERLKDDIKKRKIVSPADGEIAEVSGIKVGAVVQTGDKLAVLLPPGKLKIVAEFEKAVVGRLLASQKAQLELEGFPWTEYGRVPATVERVASETRDGFVKVELSIQQSKGSRIQLQHGMPGKIEVEIDRLTPAELILRSAGQMIESSLSGSKGVAPATQ